MTFNEELSFIQSELNDTSSSMQTYLQSAMRMKYKEITTETGWNECESSITRTSVGGQNYVVGPVNMTRMINVQIAVGGINYFPRPIASNDMWEQTQIRSSGYTSDITSLYHLDPNNVYLFPTPASNGNTITLKFIQREPEVVSSDFTDKTAGTIAVTNGSTTVTGTGTSFAASDVGDSFLMPDGYYYKVSGYTSATVLTLAKPYQGSTASGQSYILGRCPCYPPEGDLVLAYGVLSRAWSKRENQSSGARTDYEALYERGLADLKRKRKALYDDARVFDLSPYNLVNPNNFPLGLTTT